MSENKTNVPVRDLTIKQGFKLSKFLVSWEMVLVYILVLINVVLMGMGEPFDNYDIVVLIQSIPCHHLPNSILSRAAIS